MHSWWYLVFVLGRASRLAEALLFGKIATLVTEFWHVWHNILIVKSITVVTRIKQQHLTILTLWYLSHIKQFGCGLICCHLSADAELSFLLPLIEENLLYHKLVLVGFVINWYLGFKVNIFLTIIWHLAVYRNIGGSWIIENLIYVSL